MRDKEQRRVLAELAGALWELESDRTGRRRIHCNPLAVHRIRFTVAGFRDARVEVLGSDRTPLTHLYVEDLGETLGRVVA